MKNLGYLKFTLMLSVVLLAGCAEDKTVDEYQREKLQENLALYRSVEGTYSGIVYAKLDQRILGAMQLNLTAETTVSSGSSSDTAVGMPVLVANIRFLDKKVTLLSAPNGFYDPNSKFYNSQVAIARHDGSKEIVNISGYLRSGGLVGEINALPFPEMGGKFHLQKNGRSIEELLMEVRGRAPTESDNSLEEGQVISYSGVTQFKSGPKKPVRVVILQPVRGTSEDFLDLISPTQIVQVSLNYSQSLHILFPDSILDVRQGLLTGQNSNLVDGQNQNMSLSCRHLENQTMVCNHLSTGAGSTAISRVTLDSGPTEDMPDLESGADAITRAFVGTGALSGRKQLMKLVVTQPSKGRLKELMDLFFPVSEQSMVVVFNFAENMGISFPNAKWDMLNGGLEGQLISGGVESYTAYLRCDDFYFANTKKSFECRYWTSRSPIITIRFTPPFRE